jgi:hypothetical protein
LDLIADEKCLNNSLAGKGVSKSGHGYARGERMLRVDDLVDGPTWSSLLIWAYTHNNHGVFNVNIYTKNT